MVPILVVVALLIAVLGALYLAASRSGGRRAQPPEPWNRQDKLAVAGMASGLTVGIAGILVPLAGEDTVSTAKEPVGPILRVSDMQVVDHNARHSAPGLDITVENTGEQVGVITGLTLTILYSGNLEICEAGGYVFRSRTYRVQLPLQPDAGQQIDVPIKQEIRPDRVDRFVVRAGLEPHDPDLGGYYGYLVDVTLERSNQREPISAGEAVLIVPVNTAGATQTDYAMYLPDEYSQGDPCYQSNESLLRRLAGETDAALPGTLSRTPL